MAKQVPKEYTCVRCGKKGIDGSGGSRLYCSEKCRRADKYQKEIPCRFNEGVWCADKACEKCGWNPAVAKERLEKIRERWGCR